MGNTAVSRSRLFELVPRESLAGYLDSVQSATGLSLVLADDDGTPLVASSGAGPGPCLPREVWAAMSASNPDGPGELPGEGGSTNLRLPVEHKGGRFGWLCCMAGPDAGGLAGRVVALAAANIMTMAESGYEVESLSGEVVRVYEELAMIFGITARLGALVDVREICKVAAEEAMKILAAGDVMVQLVDPDGAKLDTVYAIGAHEREALAFRPDVEEGLVGRACVGQRTVLVCEVDEDDGHTGWPYPIRRLLVVPLIAEGRVVGVITSTDKRDGDEFNTREEKLVSAMASVAAIAVKNAQLYSDIRGLLEGFINASATAVEYRDPTTAGHSHRVAMLSVELARHVDASDLPAFKNANFTESDLMELFYAGLLHDFGKIGVREAVLLKGAKLYPEQMAVIKARFSFIKERRMREGVEKKLAIALGGGTDEDAMARVDDMTAAELAQIDEYFRIIESANNPRMMLSEITDGWMLDEMAKTAYSGPDGEQAAMLTGFEYDSLKVQKGSLSDAERREVESHVAHSYDFLARVPWSRGFTNITGIVHAHHEKLDGSGYPRGLKGEEIPLSSRIMAIADIFDALTAWDRPYKDAVSTQKALFVLEMEAGRGRLDPHLVQIFRDRKVYKVTGLTRKEG